MPRLLHIDSSARLTQIAVEATTGDPAALAGQVEQAGTRAAMTAAA